jgi:hypothetical protein
MPRDLELARYGRPIESVFDLLGHSENDLTAVLGFAMARSARLVSASTGISLDRARVASLWLETADVEGRTDLEIATPEALVVIEAKRAGNLPQERQLRRYARRITTFGGGCRRHVETDPHRRAGSCRQGSTFSCR